MSTPGWQRPTTSGPVGRSRDDASWHVRVRCPGCGTVQGLVTAWPDAEWTVVLATDLVDFGGCEARGCPPLTWPTVAEVERAGRRARAGRDGAVRARAADCWVIAPHPESAVVKRGRELGQGPAEWLASDAPEGAWRVNI